MANQDFLNEINKRRTFAIISHPDAGKTTITEKVLLFGQAIQKAGTVKGRGSNQHAKSDWMEMEKERGISVTTSVMQFPYNNALVNLLDTPGHEDFSEDTYRTLTAVDSCLMVIDAAKGVAEGGHTNIGAGRVVYQDLTRITKSIADGEFAETPALVEAVDAAVKAEKAVHIMGLMSPGGVHSHEDHIYAAVEMAAARGAEKIYLHCFLDGRDTPPRSAENSLQRFQDLFAKLGKGRVASLVGRYYAMDRDNNWDRVQVAYDLLTQAKAEH